MKTTFNLLFFILFATALHSQVLLTQKFQSGRFPPPPWKSYNIDNNTVHPSVSTDLTGTWQRAETTSGNNSAVSTAYYSPAGTSDDWLVTPALDIPAVSSTHKTLLSFAVMSITNSTLSELSTFELKVSTTGNSISDFTDDIIVIQTEEANEWLIQSVDLSEYAGKTIYVAWRNVSTNTLALAIDDVIVESRVNHAISLSELDMPEVIKDGETLEIRGKAMNMGAEEITSFEVVWLEGTNPQINREMITGVSIAPYLDGEFVLQKKLTAANPGNHIELKVSVAMPNNELDSISIDDTLSTAIFVNLGNTTARNVLFEKFTTSNCGFCPDGQLIEEEAEAAVDDLIAIGVHACFGSDAMTVPEATSLCDKLGNNSAPSAIIDRTYHGDPTQTSGALDLALGRTPPSGETESPWISLSRERRMSGSPVDVSIAGDLDTVTGDVSVEVSASFVDYVVNGSKSLSLIITEDSVIGTGAGYDQRNYYNSGQFGSNHPFVGAGDPIRNYVHRYVLRDILPNTWGDREVLPDTVAINTSYSRRFDFQLDSTWDQSQVYLIPLVSYYGKADVLKYEVLNAKKVKVTELFGVGLEENTSIVTGLNIYPNPSTDITTIKLSLDERASVELKLLDITGKELRYEDYGQVVAGSQVFSLDVADLSNGFYFINLRIADEIITRKIAVNK